MVGESHRGRIDLSAAPSASGRPDELAIPGASSARPLILIKKNQIKSIAFTRTSIRSSQSESTAKGREPLESQRWRAQNPADRAVKIGEGAQFGGDADRRKLVGYRQGMTVFDADTRAVFAGRSMLPCGMQRKTYLVGTSVYSQSDAHADRLPRGGTSRLGPPPAVPRKAQLPEAFLLISCGIVLLDLGIYRL